MMILHYKRKNEYLLAVLDQNGCKGTMAKMTPFGPVHARGGKGALSAVRTSSNTLALGPVPARVPRECKINVLGRPTRAILELILMRRGVTPSI